MPSIILSYYSENGEVFYDSLAEELKKLGNNVFQWNIRGYTKSKWGNYTKLIAPDIKEKIINFKPDVVLSFNNAYPQECLKYTDCKICLLDADNIEHFFNKDELIKNIDRYIFLGFKKCSKEFYEKYLKKEIKNYIYFPAATFVQEKNMKQDKNISFIGGNFLYSYIYFQRKYNNVEYSELERFYYSATKKDYFQDFRSIDNDFKKDNNSSDINVDLREEIFNYIHFNVIPGQKRVKYLSMLTDLGLVLYGPYSWATNNFVIDADLSLCYDNTPIYTLADNERVYNSSKVSVNISHPQANTCFSWRVMDIMASNSCLLTEYAQDFIDLFGQYLSEDVLSAIVYKDRYDMREKCIKLLNDEDLRNKCVKECQRAIELNGRWEKRFKVLEKNLGINFITNAEGSIIKEVNVGEIYTNEEVFEPKKVLHLATKISKKYRININIEKFKK